MGAGNNPVFNLHNTLVSWSILYPRFLGYQRYSSIANYKFDNYIWWYYTYSILDIQHFLKFLLKSNLTPILVVSIWHIFYVGSVIYWVVKFANYVLVEIKFDSYIGSINITHILCWIRDLLSCQRYWEKWPGSRASCNTCAPPSWWWWWWW